MIPFSPWPLKLLYIFCHIFSLNTLLFFDFTTCSFLIILLLKLGEIWGMTPFPKCKNSCESGLPKQKGKRSTDKGIQKRMNSPKDKGRQGKFYHFYWFPMSCPNSTPLTMMQKPREESWRKERKLWYFSRTETVKQIFS